MEWPSAAAFPLYLRSVGNANARKGDGALALSPPIEDEPRDVFIYAMLASTALSGAQYLLDSRRPASVVRLPADELPAA